MRRVALVSDIHGVVGALDAVLTATEEDACAEVWCLGDIVGHPGGNPFECVQIVEERCSVVVKGNHDAGVLGEVPLSDFAGTPAAKTALERARAELDGHPQRAKLRAYLRALPLEVVLETRAGPMLLVHASPVDPLWHDVRGEDDYRRAFSAAPRALLVLGGHTHVSSSCVRTGNGRFDHAAGHDLLSDGIGISRGAWTFANPGSVGAPTNAERHAEWAILTLDETGTPVQLDWRRTPVRNLAPKRGRCEGG